MLTRLPLSLMVELAVDWSTKYSVPSALMKSGGGFSSSAIDSAFRGSSQQELYFRRNNGALPWLYFRGDV